MILVPFIPAHLHDLELQDTQNWLQPHLLDDNYISQLTDYGESYSILVNGKVIGCGGICNISLQRGFVWALVSKDAGKYMFGSTKMVRRWIEERKYRRIETGVRTDFIAGHRWIKMLGFEREGTMKKWGEDGNDYDLYGKVK